MKKLILLTVVLLTGCEDTYRYPCQDPENKDKAECSRPQCEVDGFCFDTLNGLPPPQQTPVEEPAAPAADCNCNTETESTGE